MATDGVQVELFAAARAAVGRSTVSASPGTLVAVLDEIEREFPGFARVRPQCSYLLDGTAIHAGDLSAKIPAGSRLDVLPPFAGG